MIYSLCRGFATPFKASAKSKSNMVQHSNSADQFSFSGNSPALPETRPSFEFGLKKALPPMTKRSRELTKV